MPPEPNPSTGRRGLCLAASRSGPHAVQVYPYIAYRTAGMLSPPKGPLFLSFWRAVCHPSGDDSRQLIEPVGQRRRARLQDQRGFDLAQPAAGDRWNLRKVRPRGDLAGHEFLAAPGADDDVG